MPSQRPRRRWLRRISFSIAALLIIVAVSLAVWEPLASEAAARRAGVLIVLPLGLCFLPAFILAGLVPVLVAVLRDVL